MEDGKPKIVYATYDWDNTIVIDLKKRANPARSYLHELVHKHLGQDAPEKEVIKTERRLWRKLTQFERWLVYHRLFTQAWRNGE